MSSLGTVLRRMELERWWASNNASDADMRHGGVDMLVDSYESERRRSKNTKSDTNSTEKENTSQAEELTNPKPDTNYDSSNNIVEKYKK